MLCGLEGRACLWLALGVGDAVSVRGAVEAVGPYCQDDDESAGGYAIAEFPTADLSGEPDGACPWPPEVLCLGFLALGFATGGGSCCGSGTPGLGAGGLGKSGAGGKAEAG